MFISSLATLIKACPFGLRHLGSDNQRILERWAVVRLRFGLTLKPPLRLAYRVLSRFQMVHRWVLQMARSGFLHTALGSHHSFETRLEHRILEILRQADVVMPRSEPTASRDAKDNKFLATAEDAKADYLVSEDRDLLDLTEHQGTRVIPAHEFLQILKTLRKAA